MGCEARGAGTAASPTVMIIISGTRFDMVDTNTGGQPGLA